MSAAISVSATLLLHGNVVVSADSFEKCALHNDNALYSQLYNASVQDFRYKDLHYLSRKLPLHVKKIT